MSACDWTADALAKEDATRPTMTTPELQIKVAKAGAPERDLDANPLAPLVMPAECILMNPPGVFTMQPPEMATPLVAFINPKSGSNQGVKLITQLQGILNPRQVFNLLEKKPGGGVWGPSKGLELFKDCPRLRIMVCGGDGTVGWLLDVMDRIGISQRQIPVVFVPLGTGNDLARSFKLGAGYDGTPMKKYLLKLVNGQYGPVKLDRWAASVKRAEGTPSSLEETEYGLSATPDLPQPVFNAYFGIGSDALITLKFHNKREANPGAFKSRFMNKMKYGLQGAGVVLGRQTKKLTDGMTLVCDGKDYTSFIREKKLGAITFLNVNNYMAGCDVWGTKQAVQDHGMQFAAPSINDHLIEVVGMTGTSMIKAQMKTGVSHAIRICQCKTAVLKTEKPIPVQMDGEPSMLAGPCEIKVERKNQATVLCQAKGRYKDVGAAAYEFDDTYNVVNLYHVPISTANVSTSLDLLRSAMLPIHSTLKDVRSSHLDTEVETSLGPIRYRFLRYELGKGAAEGVYKVLSKEDEAKATVYDFLHPNSRIKPGLFVASLDGDQRLAAELFQSAAAGDNANITRLYQKGTPAVRDPAGKSALHTAVEAGKLSTVMLLLFQFNEDPDSLDKRGQTPLHMAASHGYLKIAEQLLAANAEQDVLDLSGATAADLAMKNEQFEMAALLGGGGGGTASPSGAAIVGSNPAVMIVEGEMLNDSNA